MFPAGEQPELVLLLPLRASSFLLLFFLFIFLFLLFKIFRLNTFLMETLI